MPEYVILNRPTNEFIAIDQSSGGYPYDVPVTQAKIWTTKQAAKDYYKLFSKEDWILQKLVIYTTDTEW